MLAPGRKLAPGRRDYSRDDRLLETVVAAYSTSSDFNGVSGLHLLPATNGNWGTLRGVLRRLVNRSAIEIVHQDWFPNPHIRPFEPRARDEQLTKLSSAEPLEFCVYPTRQELSKRRAPRRFVKRPYARRLWRGEPQLGPVYFDMAVLERYRLDPRYHFDFGDYSGMIGVRDEYYLSGEYPDRDKILIQTFGIGYSESGERVVAVFLRYLADLTPEHQHAWESYERRDPCEISPDYWRNAMGEFSTHVSLYSAFLVEQRVINEMSVAIGRPGLFHQTYDTARPENFHSFFLPTSRNFHLFVLELDKLLSENLNIKFFQDEVPQVRDETRRGRDPIRLRVGSAMQLEDWLQRYFQTSDKTAIETVVGPIKQVRRLRQTPAHRVEQNRFDVGYWAQQEELMKASYRSMRNLRLILAKYPGAEGVEIPDWLSEGRIRLH